MTARELSEGARESFITVVEVKHYAYCPKIVWFTHVLHLHEPVTEAMELGSEEHDERFITPLIKSLKAVKVLRNVELESEKLKLRGKVDYVLITRFGEHVPIEVKWAEPARGGGPKRDHKLQLAAYALMIEELTDKSVKRAAIYYARVSKIVVFPLDEHEKREARRIIKRIHEMVETGKEPTVRVPKSRCINCGFRRYCMP